MRKIVWKIGLSEKEMLVLSTVAQLILPRSDKAQEIGVSLRLLNRQIKESAGIDSAMGVTFRVLLHRVRKSLEEKGYIETYHMDSDHMVSDGPATHVVLTGKAQVLIGFMFDETITSTVTEESAVSGNADA